MSKAIKDMLTRDYKARFEGAADAMVISIRGVKAIPTTKMRKDLATKKIKVTVVRNSLARKAIAGTPLEPLGKLLEGPSALAFGGTSVVEVAREIVKLLATMPELELKGAVLDGQLFEGKKGVTELSKFPTREEAIGQAVTLIVSPGRKLAAQVLGPGSTVAGIVKAIEAKLEKGEAIAATA
ncbi:MAG: 50S ribosomal protein L10 [Phycisphaerae bacterium]|nr:50S ribosomal protein L10 [Phycisphaerae bacterium]